MPVDSEVAAQFKQFCKQLTERAVTQISGAKFDPVFNTDWYASASLEFPDIEMTFYVSTQMADRQDRINAALRKAVKA